MLAYVTLGTNNLERSKAFYNDLLSLLDAKIAFEDKRGVAWSNQAGPMLMTIEPFNGEPACVGNGSMVALAASNPEQVRALHARALALGGVDEGAPGERADTFYAAYFRDMDGNKLAAFCVLAAQ